MDKAPELGIRTFSGGGRGGPPEPEPKPEPAPRRRSRQIGTGGKAETADAPAVGGRIETGRRECAVVCGGGRGLGRGEHGGGREEVHHGVAERKYPRPVAAFEIYGPKAGTNVLYKLQLREAKS